MTRSLPRLQIAMCDFLGSWDLVWPTWRQWRALGRIVEHRTGPDTALYEIADNDALALFVSTVDAQRGPQMVTL